MRTIILVIFAICMAGTMTSCATVKISNLQPVERIVETDRTKMDNYIKANEWMVEAFVNAESVIQFSDKETGIIKGKYNMFYARPIHVGYGIYTPERRGDAVVTINVKDGAAKIRVDGGNVPTVSSSGFTIPTLADYTSKIEKLIGDFMAYMNTENTNW